ncbi:MAG: hypothetical protein K0R39_4523 [Symbiobacteriaceae bacterium]|nr:hypothetical protein [Symbiobacteriaceae bacterium]
MIKFAADRRPSKWGATAAVAQNQTAEAVIEWLAGRNGHPFDGAVKLSEVTENKGYRYALLQVSLDFGHPSFGKVADLLDEMGGSEFHLIVVETPERAVYLIVDKENLPDEEIRPDHPLLAQLADWLGPALARR